MAFVSPGDALAYLRRVDADVFRLSRSINDKAPPLDPEVFAWKRWRTEWVAFNAATEASGATWNTVAVFDEVERREIQLKGWYAAAAKRGWAPAGPLPAGPPGESGVPGLSSLLLVGAAAAAAVLVWRVTR